MVSGDLSTGATVSTVKVIISEMPPGITPRPAERQRAIMGLACEPRTLNTESSLNTAFNSGVRADDHAVPKGDCE
jgi:hypothetical protein